MTPMKPINGSEFFSLDARRRLEAEKAKARRATEAQATRIVARLACERRHRDVQTVVAEAEIRALRKFGRSLSTLWEMARAVVRRLREEDRSATLAAAEDVALAIEAEPTAQPPKANGGPASPSAGKEIQ